MSKFSQVLQEIKRHNHDSLEEQQQTAFIAFVGLVAFLGFVIFAPMPEKQFAFGFILFPLGPAVLGLMVEWNDAKNRLLSKGVELD